MKKAILGRKLGMTQVFDNTGKAIPVTVIEAGPCTVVQIKTTDCDGYDAVQLGFGEVKEKKLIRPIKGHFTKANVTPKKHLREFRLEEISYNVGDEIKADIFKEGETVDVTGTSKGKGFQGVIIMDNQEDQWDMVQCIIEDQVQWVQHQLQVEFSKVKNYQDIWVLIQ